MASKSDNNPLAPTEQDIQTMLAAQCHLGTKNENFQMADYRWKRRADGINIFHLGKTWEKIMLAARLLVTIENPADIAVVSARPFGQRAVLKFQKYTGAKAVAGNWISGTLTNQQQSTYFQPRVLVVSDPLTDHQAIKEASYTNCPVIAFCDSDAPLKYVDIAIPINTKGKHSLGLAWYLLCRELLRLRGSISREEPFTLPDVFIYRDQVDEAEQEAEQEAAAAGADAAPAAEWTGEQPASGDWGDSAAAGGNWDGAAAQPAAASWDAAGAAGTTQNWGDAVPPQQGGQQW